MRSSPFWNSVDGSDRSLDPCMREIRQWGGLHLAPGVGDLFSEADSSGLGKAPAL